MSSILSKEEVSLLDNLIYTFTQFETDYNKAKNPREGGVTTCLNHLMQVKRLGELWSMNPGKNPWDSSGEDTQK